MTAAAIVTKRYRARRADGGLRQDHIIQASGTLDKHAEFLSGHPAKPVLFDGPVEFEDEVFHLDLGPATADFNAPPPPALTRAQLRTKFGYDDADVNWAMDLRLLPRPTLRVDRASEREGGRVSGGDEFWAAADVEKFAAIRARLLGNRAQ